MDEAKKLTTDEIRQTAITEQQRLADALAPSYLGKKCPLKNGGECDGPHCMLYTPLNDNPQKPNVITGGSCLIPVAVHEIMVFNQQLGALGQLLSNIALNSGTRLIKPT